MEENKVGWLPKFMFSKNQSKENQSEEESWVPGAKLKKLYNKFTSGDTNSNVNHPSQKSPDEPILVEKIEIEGQISLEDEGLSAKSPFKWAPGERIKEKFTQIKNNLRKVDETGEQGIEEEEDDLKSHWVPGDRLKEKFTQIKRKFEKSESVDSDEREKESEETTWMTGGKVKEMFNQFKTNVQRDHSTETDESWYLGREIVELKRKQRRAAQDRTLEKVREEHVDSSRHPTFGNLTVSNVVLEDLVRWGQKSPYVVFSIETRSICTPRAPSKGPHSWNEWSCTIPISDVWADLHVMIFAAKPGSEVISMDDELVGKVIVPLSNVVRMSKIPWHRTLMKKSQHKVELVLEILNLEKGIRLYHRCVDGLSATGTERPKEMLGHIRFQVQLDTNCSLGHALLSIPPFRVLAPMPLLTETMTQSEMLHRKLRVAHISKKYKNFVLILCEGLISLENPFATWIWLTWITQLLFFSEVYQLPFVLSVGLVFASYFVYLKEVQNGKKTPPFFVDEMIDDPDLPRTFPQKLKQLVKIVSSLQRLLGKIASLSERFYHSLSWDDPFVSFLVSISIVVSGFVLSLLLGLLMLFSFELRLILFLCILFFHLPLAIQQRILLKIKFKQIRRARETENLEEPSPNISFDSEIEPEEIINQVLPPIAQPQEGFSPEESVLGGQGLKEKLIKGAHNLLKRIPDAREIDHRRIANARILQAETFD